MWPHSQRGNAYSFVFQFLYRFTTPVFRSDNRSFHLLSHCRSGRQPLYERLGIRLSVSFVSATCRLTTRRVCSLQRNKDITHCNLHWLHATEKGTWNCSGALHAMMRPYLLHNGTDCFTIGNREQSIIAYFECHTHVVEELIKPLQFSEIDTVRHAISWRPLMANRTTDCFIKMRNTYSSIGFNDLQYREWERFKLVQCLTKLVVFWDWSKSQAIYDCVCTIFSTCRKTLDVRFSGIPSSFFC